MNHLGGGAEKGDGGVRDKGAHGAVHHLADRDDVAVEAVAEDKTNSCSSKCVEKCLSSRLR